MTFWKFFIFAFLFFVLALIQNSFLPYFSVIGVVPNLVFALFFILVFFEPANRYSEGLLYTIIAGFLLDLLSFSYFGINIGALLLTYIAIKVILHFLKERQKGYLLAYFIFIFLGSFIVYTVAIFLCTDFPHIAFLFRWNTMVLQLAYNVITALIGFFIYKIFNGTGDRQLSLFS